MNIEENISLKPYNTFGIDVRARYFIAVDSVEALQSVLKLENYGPKFILGGGSNMLLTRDIEALVVQLNLKGCEILSETGNKVRVRVSAGENWHDFVTWCLSKDYGGIENLSLIPGNVGAAPIQNIGAYGVELKDVFVSCDALNKETGIIETFSKAQCRFDYRNSVFKQELKGKYIILDITLELSKTDHELKTSYGAIKGELENMGADNPSIHDVSKAVISIRKSKLPNPAVIGNSGSFFKNPVISGSHYDSLKSNFPEIPSYVVGEDQFKVPAGWLIEQAGFKGKRYGDYGVHKDQALVLVNYDDAKGDDILKLSQLIQFTIRRIFGINLEAEVNIL
jgi:UDP-N-acetylmuramate dehydrogenase